MSEITILEPTQGFPIPVMDYEQWATAGRKLAYTRLHLDFAIGDWLAQGRENFAPEQIEMVLGEIATDAEQAKRLRQIERVAKAFPPALRNSALTFEHHAHLADLPVQEALPLLKKAGEEHLNAKQVRVQAVLRKVDLGMILPREEDPEDDAMLALCRAWNRAPLNVREDFAFMVGEAEEAGFRVIEP
jgi:hypothetical protein